MICDKNMSKKINLGPWIIDIKKMVSDMKLVKLCVWGRNIRAYNQRRTGFRPLVECSSGLGLRVQYRLGVVYIGNV